jgi:hypothetical protein
MNNCLPQHNLYKYVNGYHFLNTELPIPVQFHVII